MEICTTGVTLIEKYSIEGKKIKIETIDYEYSDKSRDTEKLINIPKIDFIPDFEIKEAYGFKKIIKKLDKYFRCESKYYIFWIGLKGNDIILIELKRPETEYTILNRPMNKKGTIKVKKIRD